MPWRYSRIPRNCWRFRPKSTEHFRCKSVYSTNQLFQSPTDSRSSLFLLWSCYHFGPTVSFSELANEITFAYMNLGNWWSWVTCWRMMGSGSPICNNWTNVGFCRQNCPLVRGLEAWRRLESMTSFAWIICHQYPGKENKRRCRVRHIRPLFVGRVSWYASLQRNINLFTRTLTVKRGRHLRVTQANSCQNTLSLLPILTVFSLYRSTVRV